MSKFLRLAGAWAALALFLVLPRAEGADFIVTTTNSSGAGSLYDAITNANSTPGLDRILFNLPGVNRSIRPTASTPLVITDPVILDGTSQPGYAGLPVIELNGLLAGSGTVGLRVQAGNCVVRGLVINHFSGQGLYLDGGASNVVQNNFIGTDVSGTGHAGNGMAGIYINRSAWNLIGGTNSTQRNLVSSTNHEGIYLADVRSYSNVIQGNFIGTTVSGTAPLGNLTYGIFVYNSCSNLIGGSSPGAGNLISGNSWAGLALTDVNTKRNVVQGNIIGLDATGTLVLGNTNVGVMISLASANVIGGTVPAARNVISGNQQHGVFLEQPSAVSNIIQGNYIGTDFYGTNSRGNASAGVAILAGASSNLVGGTNSGAGNLISANQQQGIFLTNSTGNLFQGNFIGLDASGTRAVPNLKEGIALNNASFNTIGGQALGARNIISGNNNHGIGLLSLGCQSNVIQGNFIGTDVSGRVAVGNHASGVDLENAPYNLVGGTFSSAGNTISGNTQNGVVLLGTNAIGNQVQGNLIGTDATGTNRAANGGAGVLINDAPASVIGGGSDTRNIISGNGNSGIYMLGATGPKACWTTIRGNYIGADLSGFKALANAFEGIYILGSSSNTIGGTDAGAGNLISGNSTWGMMLSNSAWNVLQGNFIGTGADGWSALPNGMAHGIELGVAHDNIIGGPAPGAGNHIAFAPAPYAGIRIRHQVSTNNLISGNAMFSNGGLALKLGGPAGVTPNDNCDTDVGDGLYGGNMLQNFPELTNAVSDLATRIDGQLNSAPNRSYTLEFFANPACRSLGYEDGTIYLGQGSVSLGNSCSNTFSVTLPVSVPSGYVVTATATDPYNNTSELSLCKPVIINTVLVLMGCPTPAVSVSCLADVPPKANVTANGNCTGTISVQFNETSSGPDCNKTILRTWTATDGCGNATNCTQTITVKDTTAPLLTKGSIAAYYADVLSAEAAAKAATGSSDNCGGAVTLSASTVGACSAVITVTGTDPCGNSASVTYNTRIDSTKPVLMGCPASTVTVQCVADVPVKANVTANDNCDGTVVVQFNENSSGPDCNKTIVRTWTATDTSGNTASCAQTITVKDTTTPVLTKGSIAASYADVPSAEAAAKAATGSSDNCGGAVTLSASTVGSCSAVITVTGTDPCGNSASVTYNTHIDSTKPVLTGCPASTISVQCLADVPVKATVTANDNCDGTVAVQFNENSSGPDCNKTIVRTWTATDTHGNTTTCSQTITVKDTTAPTLTKGTIATCYADVASAEADAMAATGSSDNCGGAVTLRASTVGSCSALITVTGTDGCGNSASVNYSTYILPSLIIGFAESPLNSVSLSWTNCPGVSLMEKAELSTALPWTWSTNVPAPINGRVEVIVPATNVSRFYRLFAR